MNTTPCSAGCLIVGAGLAGLQAARVLAAAGIQTIVLEKGSRPGGRMATVSLSSPLGVAIADEGAQYFTVRDAAFREQVGAWLAAGIAHQWSNGFVTPDGSAFPDGHPRYCGTAGMTTIPDHLADRLDIRLGSEVTSISYEGRWLLSLASGELLEARALLLTPPVPQSLALLAQAGIPLPAAEAAVLQRIDYDPCLAITAILTGPSRMPAPGGLWPGGARIYWMADNHQKGISALPAVTIHATAAYSREHFEDEQGDIVAALLTEAASWLGGDVVASRLRRWRYSIPLQLYPAHTLLLHAPGPLAFAGDAFAGPRVEGAVLSGIAAGRALAATLLR
jgi:renalase